MTRFSTLRLAVATAAALTLPWAQAANPMSGADYQAGQARVSAAYKADKAACAPLKGNAKDICKEEAKAKEKVALGELEFARSGDAKDGIKVWTTRADTAYAVAKEKCDDLRGNAKDVCRQEAKTNHTKALADAKLGKQVAEARQDAAATKRDAEYKLAAQKCDALSGDAKSQCVDSAKRSYGKM
jgi:hypothetical protein